MKYPVFSFKDCVSGLFSSPIIQTNENVAKRTFRLVVNNPESIAAGSKAEDYALYHVGFFDDQTGVLESVDPEFLMQGMTIEKEVKENAL